MSLDTQSLIAVSLILAALAYAGYRFHLAMERNEFIAECKKRAHERLWKKTGWEELDSVNWLLLMAHKERGVA